MENSFAMIGGRKVSLQDFLSNNGKRELPARNEELYNGNVVSVEVPACVGFFGAEREKKINGEKVALNLNDVTFFTEELPPASVAKIWEYGLQQYLADGFASAKTPDEAQAMFLARLTNLATGTFSRRGSGTGKAKAKVPSDYGIIAKLFADKLAKLTMKNFGGPKPPVKEKDLNVKWREAEADALKLLASLPKVQKIVADEKARLAALQAEIAEDEEDILGGLLDDSDESEDSDTSDDPDETENEDESADAAA